MSRNPYAGTRVIPIMPPGRSVEGAKAHDGPMSDQTSGMYRGGGVAQPSLGDLSQLLRGSAGAQLRPRDDQGDEQPGAK